MVDIIVFGEDYGAHPSSTQHIINRLSKRHRVIWFNSVGLRAPRCTRRDMGRLFKKAYRIIKSSVSTTNSCEGDEDEAGDENQKTYTFFPVISPLFIPFPQFATICKINRHILQCQVRAIIQKYDLIKPLLWISLPTAVDAICADVGKVIYYCGDDFGALDGVDHKTVAAYELDLIEKANLILTASETLQQKMPASKTHLLTHGVDTRLFLQQHRKPALMDRGRPVALFYGSLANWVQFEWIAYAAEHMKDWDFVLIGAPKTDISVLEEHPNIHLLGEIAHDRLVSYAAHADALLMLFKDNKQIHSCNPLKLLEYMATGRPILSTDFPAIHQYKKHVKVVNNKESIPRLLNECLSEPEVAGLLRRQAVQGQDWEDKAREVEQQLWPDQYSKIRQ